MRLSVELLANWWVGIVWALRKRTLVIKDPLRIRYFIFLELKRQVLRFTVLHRMLGAAQILMFECFDALTVKAGHSSREGVAQRNASVSSIFFSLGF